MPSYYVVLTKRGWKEKTVHFWTCVAVTIGLFIPPVFFLVADGLYWQYFVLLAFGLLPGMALLKLTSRKPAVLMMLVFFTVFIGFLVVSIQTFRTL